MDDLKISELHTVDEIFPVISDLSQYLSDRTLHEPKRLMELAVKYAAHAKVIIASSGGKASGICAFYCNDTETKTAYITMIIVAKSAQGCGIGSLFLKETAARSKACGMEKIRLQVLNRNQNAISFYKNHGFTLEKQQETSSYYICKI